MATVPRAWIDGYADSLQHLDAHMRSMLKDALAKVDYTAPVAEVRRRLIAIMQPMCYQSRYSAAQLAAEFYDGLRERMVGEGIETIVDAGYEPEAVERVVRASVKPLADIDGWEDAERRLTAEASDRVGAMLVDYFGRGIREAAGNTVFANGRRDPRRVRFARVPRGSKSYPEGCPFCIMLASRGFAYLSELTAGGVDPRHYHDGCQCMVVPSWGPGSIEGYDPNYYLALYNDPEAAKHMAPPGPKHKAPKEQRNIGPDAPMFRRRTSATRIAECARDANPHYAEIATAIGERDKLVAELNSMLPITRDNAGEYRRKYEQFEAAKKDAKRLYREWSQNCQRCVVAYELRRRGYDVTARKRLARNDAVRSRWKSYFVNQRWTNVGDSDATIALSNLEKELAGYGDGSRSIVYVAWQGGGAHVFIAERQHGKTVFVNPQDGQVDYDWMSKAKPNSVQVSRVDDKEVDASIIKKVVKEGR